MVRILSSDIPGGLPSTRIAIGNSDGVGGRQPSIGLKRNVYPNINPSGHFYVSINSQERVPHQHLRNFSRTVPAQRAIARIVDGVLAMSWSVSPREESKDDPVFRSQARRIEDSLRRPNRDNHNTYSKLVGSLITEIIILGVATVERQPGDPQGQCFWLWDANAANIHINPDWAPQRAGIVPRFFDMTVSSDGRQSIPIMDENLFLVQRRTNSWEFIPPSQLETAYSVISAWLGVSEFQQLTTSRATQEYILDLGDVSEEQLSSFREYWETDVQGEGRMPIIAGKGLMKTEKIGAANDAGLYHQYTEYLLKIIAFCFGLNPRDFNLTEHDNRATAGASADSSFAEAILPMALTIIEHLQLEVVDFYYPTFELKLNDTEPRTEEQEAGVAANLFEKGIITKNEARARVKEKPVKDGEGFSPSAAPPEVKEGAAIPPKPPSAPPAKKGVALGEDSGTSAIKAPESGGVTSGSGDRASSTGGKNGGSPPGKKTSVVQAASKPLKKIAAARPLLRPYRPRDFAQDVAQLAPDPEIQRPTLKIHD